MSAAALEREARRKRLRAAALEEEDRAEEHAAAAREAKKRAKALKSSANQIALKDFMGTLSAFISLCVVLYAAYALMISV